MSMNREKLSFFNLDEHLLLQLFGCFILNESNSYFDCFILNESSSNFYRLHCYFFIFFCLHFCPVLAGSMD